MKDLATLNAAEVQSMSSKEIAELTGKQHKNVMRDIREMLKELYGIDGSNLSHDKIQGVTAHVDERGYISVVFLDKSHSTTLVTGYNATLRKIIIDRWTELEEAARPKAVATFPTPHALAKSVIADILEIAALVDIPLHTRQQEAFKEASRYSGIDLVHLLDHAPAQNAIIDEDVMLEPTEFGERFDLKASAFNKVLADIGLQARIGGVWVATDKGKPLCSRHAWVKGSKSGYNYKWSVAKVSPLVDEHLSAESA